jgi:predicted lactoylglutathione lyase
MEQRISFMTLGVADIDRARAFYEALGWSGTSPDGQIWLFQLNGLILGLFERDELALDCVVEDNGGWGGIQLTQLVRSPAEVDAILASAEVAGGTIARLGEKRVWGYTGLFFDPDGHPWEIITHPTWIIGPDGSTRMP